jgi:hypothetical protein
MNTAAHIIHYLSLLVYISTNVTVIWYAFPAYKLFKRPAFLLWSFSSALCVFVTAFDWTIGRHYMTPSQYYIYYDVRQLSFYAAAIIGVTGTLLFIQEYRSSKTSTTIST